MSRGWLKCTVTQGMFSDERAIAYSRYASQPYEYSVFVPATLVREQEPTAVSVNIIRDNGHTYVVLPDDVRTVIPVNPDDLTT